MFIRFVVGAGDEHHRLLTGLITEARLLRDRGELAAYEAEQLEETYEWFNTNLPQPPFSTAGWSRDAVTWFRDSAHDYILRMREIGALLESHGVLSVCFAQIIRAKFFMRMISRLSFTNGNGCERVG
jgi:hypothetical protein